MFRVRLERVDRVPPLPWVGAVLVAVWVVAAGIAALALSGAGPGSGPVPASCVFKRVTGAPCATCGGTRMVASVWRGDLPGAFLLNPFLFVALGVVAGWLVLRLVFARRVAVEAPVWLRVGFWAFVAGAFVGNWAMLVVRGV